LKNFIMVLSCRLSRRRTTGGGRSERVEQALTRGRRTGRLIEALGF
jgi:hypothetical protein